jgi:hypothetical protein
LEDIYDDRVKEILEQIDHAASEALEKMVDLAADPVKTRQWQNVSRMSHVSRHEVRWEKFESCRWVQTGS